MADDSGSDPTQTPASSAPWMNDVQRALALILIGTIAFATVVSTAVEVLVAAPSDALVDMVKTLQAAVVNMSLIALGFFFGSNMSKMLADVGQQKIVDKLTSNAPPPGGPVAPVPAPPAPVVVAWWSKLTEAERSAINAAAAADPQIKAFADAAAAGRATPTDLAAVVSKGLLSQQRADEISAA